MNKTKSTVPPLSQQEVLALKGKPMAKIVLESIPPRRDSGEAREEWVYVSAKDNRRETYLFQKGRLVAWNAE